MRQHSIPSIAFAVGLLVFQQSGGTLYAQTAVPTPQELDQLLAPIALYPDTLLAQITTASTDPQQILDVDAWLQQNSTLSGDALQSAAQQQGFDPAFIALAAFPQVLDMMAQNIDDYAAIGDAFAANQASVMDSIQRLRAQAYSAGSLQTSPQQQVMTQNDGGQQVIVIQPANPQIVYVPVYDPTLIFAPPPGMVAGGLLTFGAGIGIGAFINSQPWGWGGWGWNWGHRMVLVNRNPWAIRYNRYRPPRSTFRRRPVVFSNRPGYGGNWSYRPRNYRPPSSNRPPNNAGNRPPNRPPSGGNRPPNNAGNRPPSGGNRPPNNAGNRPPSSGDRPGNANNRPPANAGPPSNRPSNPNPPSNANRPTGNNRGGNRPAQQPRNQFAGYQPPQGGGGNPQGGRRSALNANNSGGEARAASNRGQQSMRGGGGGGGRSRRQ